MAKAQNKGHSYETMEKRCSMDVVKLTKDNHRVYCIHIPIGGIWRAYEKRSL